MLLSLKKAIYLHFKIIIFTSFVLLILSGASFSALSQVHLTGKMVDANTLAPLAYVNIGIKIKNKGTTSLADGSFSITIPQEYVNDTLTFSLVGYHLLDIPISSLSQQETVTIQLHEKTTQLSEVKITAEKLTEKKYGIKRRNLLLHFTDGMFESDDIFEIGQLIKLGNTLAQITSVNLHINAPRADSATFRINFYRYADSRPAGRLIEKSILQRHPVKQGWLRFDLEKYNLRLKGNFVVSIEFIPEPKKGIRPIYYEVKLGGSSRSFYRRNSLGQWNTPPHHYCLYVTALVDKSAPAETEDTETIPTLALPSEVVKDSFSLFIRLPKDYHKNSRKKYPVIYHLDANAYFDHISHAVVQLTKKKQSIVEPIIVGIGYENAYVMDSLRVRDYTFPQALPSDSLAISGGGEKFYEFLKTELVPYIDKVYRTDTTNRTIMGHSFGGYFTLYALLRDIKEQKLFKNYIAASPSLPYYDNYLVKQFENLSLHQEQENVPQLYLTIGEMEVEQDPEDKFNHFSQLLSEKGFIRLKIKIYKGLEHMGTAVPSFEDGVVLVQEK